MRGRSARRRSAYAGSSGGLLETDADNFSSPAGSILDSIEDEDIFRADSSHYECGSFASRSSMKLLNDVVSKLDCYKKELIISTGFSGVLQFPSLKQINRKFALWLMSCVDESTRTLVVGDDIRIKFSKQDVHTVFGIPFVGKRVVEPGVCYRSAKEKVLDKYLGAKFKEFRSIKHLQEVIEREYSLPMSKAEKDCFRVSFVVFVVSTLLSPGAKFDYAIVDYWGAIQDADAIAEFDWAEFVIGRLLEAVCKLKQDVSSRVKFPNITGCSLFIQVLYLDSLDLGELSIAQNSLPRIKHFSFEKYRCMIAADRNFVNYLNGNNDGGATMLREGRNCCYTWAFEFFSSVEIPRTGALLAIWESCVAMARFFDIPMEAAGPLFVAAADFQDQVDCGLARPGIYAVKCITVLVSIMAAFKDGYSYKFSMDDKKLRHDNIPGHDPISRDVSGGLSLVSFPLRLKRKDRDASVASCFDSTISNVRGDFDVSSEPSSSQCRPRKLRHTCFGAMVQSSINEAISSLEILRPELNVNQRLVTAMSKFYSLVRRLKLPVDLDLNASSVETSDCVHGSLSLCPSMERHPPAPWCLGSSWSIDDVNTPEVFARLNRMRHEEGFTIVHSCPKLIQVSARSFSAQILGDSEVELDMFDAIIRLMRQDDDKLYEAYSTKRWRHFFETDFMAVITSGCFDMSYTKLTHHFSRAIIKYDLSSCKFLFFPAIIHYRWVCYAWSLEFNRIYVFDPSFHATVPDSFMDCHERICFLLKSAMYSISRALFNSWKFEWLSADLRMVTLAERNLAVLNRSGVICSLFCRCFDGDDFMPKLSRVDSDAIAAKLACEIVKLKGNIGRVPSYLF